MKLPIKHEYFVQIQNGAKKVELRDAHLTLMDESTKDTMRVEVKSAIVRPRKIACKLANLDEEKVKDILEDENTIIFYL